MLSHKYKNFFWTGIKHCTFYWGKKIFFSKNDQNFLSHFLHALRQCFRKKLNRKKSMNLNSCFHFVISRIYTSGFVG